MSNLNLAARLTAERTRLELHREWAYKQIGRAVLGIGTDSETYRTAVRRGKKIQDALYRVQEAQDQIKKLGGY